MKPDWKEAPEWANYLAMDKYGEWYWFETRPRTLNTVFDTDDRMQRAFIIDWKDSLEQRP